MRILGVAAACAGIAVLCVGTACGADDPKAAFARAAGSVLANYTSVAQGWYRSLDRSQPAPPPLVVRLTVPKSWGGFSFRVEYVLAPDMPRGGIAWSTTRQWACHAADCDKLTLTGNADKGSLAGDIIVKLPDDLNPGELLTLRILVTAAVTQGQVAGTVVSEVRSTQVAGTVSGAVLTAAAAAADSAVRAMPPLDLKTATATETYAAAALAEQDLCALYRGIRVFAAAQGARSRFVEAWEANPVPVPVRPAYGAQKAAGGKPAAGATPGKGPAPKKSSAKTPDVPDLDGGEELGLDAGPAAKAPPPQSKGDDPAEMRARLPALQAMAEHTDRIRAVVATHLSGAAAPAVQRGRTYDDPLFGPWYGIHSLAPKSNLVNRLPADFGQAGVQDWPFVHGWMFVGPFAFTPLSWDPIHLPDCFPTPEAEYGGKAGPARWRQADIRATGSAMFTDLASLAEAVEDEPASSEPARPAPVAVYFGSTVIEAERDGEVILAAGCCGRMSIWQDEVLVARGPQIERPQDLAKEAMIFTVKLHRGANRIFVRSEPEAYGLFTHRRPGTASYFWMRACTRGAPGDPKTGAAWLDAAAQRKQNLPNLPPNVRGYRHDQTGYYPDADPVTAWDIDRGINVRWTTALERWSKASPLLVGDRVFVCAEPHVLLCLDALSGKILWRRSANVLELAAPAAFRESERLHQEFLDAQAALAPKRAELGPDYSARVRALAAGGLEVPRAVAQLRGMESEPENKYRAFFSHLQQNGKLVAPAWDGHYSGPWLGYTFASPVTDGKRVYVKFATGVVACYDLEGNRSWMTHTPYTVGDIAVCSSPVLADDKVVISQVAEASAGQFSDMALLLTAMDAATGRVVWTSRAHEASGRPTTSPVVMRLTDGKQDMTVVATGGGTVVRVEDGKMLVRGLPGSSGTGTPTPVGDVLYRINSAQSGGVQLIMLDRDHVGARWMWSNTGRYNAIYAGVGYRDGIFFGTCHGGSQSIGARGLNLIDAATGVELERPFNRERKREGIFADARYGFVPPVCSARHIYLAVRGAGHPSSLQEELPGKWSPWTHMTVAQFGPKGRFVAHNKVLGLLTPHFALAGDRVYSRNDHELVCFGYTGEEGQAYEAEVNAATLLADIPAEPPAEAAGAALWREGLVLCRPYLERAIRLKPDGATARKAKDVLARLDAAR